MEVLEEVVSTCMASSNVAELVTPLTYSLSPSWTGIGSDMQIESTPRVLLVGLGAVGRAVGAAILSSSRCVVVGAVDTAPALVGAPLSSIIPGVGEQASIAASIADAPRADIAFVATTSFIHQVEPTIHELLNRGMHVVSICEELGFGFYDHDVIADRIDVKARQEGLVVLGTGCNPGILMDTLPLALSSLTLDVKSVSMRRSADMSGYGGILSKFGFGLTEQEFVELREAKAVIGHVGFRESIAALADGLGWRLDEIVVEEPQPVLLTKGRREARYITLEPGTIAAIRHSVYGAVAGRKVIEAEINFGIFECGDPLAVGGTWRIESDFQALEFSAGLLDSYLSTVAVAANVIPSVPELSPGLRTMADLPVKRFAALSKAMPVATF